MSHPIRFGIMLLQNLPYPVLVERCQHLEFLGFDSVWVGDHFVDPYVPTGSWFEGWTLLAGLAAETKRIRLGPLVTSITLRNPSLLARQAMTIDHISNGRLELGIGAGRAPLDHSMTGIPVWETPERARRFRECVEIVDQMLRNPTTTYVGQYYQIKDAAMTPMPIQQPRPPLTLAAHGPMTLKVAARYADSWNSFGKFNASADESLIITRERNQMLDEYCVAQGRDPQMLRRTFLAGFTAEKPFASVQAFHDFVGRYRENRIDELIFYWLPEDGHPVMPEKGLNGVAITSRDMLECIATEAIPAIKAKGTG
jgi:alkanesulfonate monooxygenase SsuD/methylene tetrahydromethanopterin reductase-like flavin-dependent oxidoreductase (luciferase family)